MYIIICIFYFFSAMQESTVSKVDVISGIEVFTQDTDFDLSDDELAFL